MTDVDYMRRAIELAQMGEGFTNPNPMVGAVIVKDGRIIGQGYHERCGELHAERNAIASLTESAEGATIYVTLEPCIMCASAIQQARIKNVYYGTKDIRMGGYGSKIDVSAIQGLNHYPIIHQIKNQDECGQILKDFFKRIRSAK